MRTLFRLTLLGLAGYGAKSLYDRYGDRLRELREPATDFADRTERTFEDFTSEVSDAAAQVVSSARDTSQDLSAAAADATAEAQRRLSGDVDAR